MRKRSLIALPVVLVAGAVVTFLLSDRLLFATIQSLIAATTPYRLQLVDSSVSWHPFRLRSALLLVEPAHAQSAPLFAVQQLDVTGSVLDWITGTRAGSLSADNLSIYVDAKAPGGRPEASTVLKPLTLFPTRIDIRTLHFISRGDDVWIFPVQNVSAQRRADGAIASTSYPDNPLVLETLLTPQVRLGRVQGVDIIAGVTGRDDTSRLVLDGTLRAADDNLLYDLALTGNYANVSDFLTAFDEDAFALEGRLSVAGQLRGSYDELRLRIDELVLEQDDAYRLRVDGELTQQGTESPVLAVNADGFVAGAAALPLLPPPLREHLGDGTLTLRVEGTLAEPIIQSVALSARSADGLQLRADAQDLRANSQDLLATLDAVPVRLALRGDSVASLAALVEAELPAFGAWTLDAVLHRAGNDYRLEDVSGELQLDDSGRVTATGAVGQIRAAADGAPVGIEDIALRLALRGEGSGGWQGLGALTGLPAPVGSARLDVRGSIADAGALRGIALDLTLDELEVPPAASTPDWIPLPLRVRGRGALTRAGAEWRFDGLALEGRFADTASATLEGSAATSGEGLGADLTLQLLAEPGRHLPSPGTLHLVTSGASVQLRLRERFATALAEIRTSHAPLQAVLSADLDAGAVRQLSFDLYSKRFDLDDLALERAAPDAPEDGPAFDWQRLRPPIPVHATLRVEELRGSRTAIDSLAIDVEASGGRTLLRQLDARYAGGSMQLRGVLDASGEVPAVSLAGLGYRMPLADLTRDLGLTEKTTGTLSLRGGASAVGDSGAALLQTLQGRVALAADNVTVAGPAYDLLMSNLLAWLVTGAQENTTTFDCSMAQFDIADGVADSDTLYVETPRMVATGKARIDLAASTLDVRLQPRSRTRTVQFPSAVKISGPLANPTVNVSPLQSTFDAATQALLLVPGLTLRLFGLGAGDGGPPRPCEASLQ